MFTAHDQVSLPFQYYLFNKKKLVSNVIKFKKKIVYLVKLRIKCVRKKLYPVL